MLMKNNYLKILNQNFTYFQSFNLHYFDIFVEIKNNTIWIYAHAILKVIAFKPILLIALLFYTLNKKLLQMLTKGFIKPKISIDKVGKRQFWTGIIIGVMIAFILSYFFNYYRESLRMITFMTNPYILTEKEFRLYDLFFASFATSLGFGFTIIYWLSGRNKNIKKKYLKTFTVANAWLINFITLMLVGRFGSILPIIVYGLPKYDGHLDLLNNFWLMLVLIPWYLQ